VFGSHAGSVDGRPGWHHGLWVKLPLLELERRLYSPRHVPRLLRAARGGMQRWRRPTNEVTMKPVVLHPGSVVVGVVLAVLGVVAVGAQSAKGGLGRNPRGMDDFSPPVPVRALEYIPAVYAAASATNQDVVTVHQGERMAIVGVGPSRPGQLTI